MSGSRHFNGDKVGYLGYNLGYCKNTTENGHWCKSHDHIDAWLRNFNQFFVYQKTRVDAEMMSDDPSVENPDNYLPII